MEFEWDDARNRPAGAPSRIRESKISTNVAMSRISASRPTAAGARRIALWP